MPRKSTGGASGASAPGTPASKPSAPRKSLNGASTPSADDPSTALTVPGTSKLVLKQQETALKGIESFELPRSNIVRCAKTDIPDSVQLRKEVQQALVKSATVFISYLTAAAHDKATKKGKIISAQHVLDAMRQIDLGGEEELAEMRAQLKGYRENVVRKKSDKAAGAGEKKGAEGEAENDADVSRLDGGEDEEDADLSVRDGDAQGDESMLRHTLHAGAARDDEDQLMED